MDPNGINNKLNVALQQSIGCEFPIENHRFLYLCFSNDDVKVIDIVNDFYKNDKKVHSIYELKPSKAGTCSIYETLICIATKYSIPTDNKTTLKKIHLVFEKKKLGISITFSI